MLSLPLPATDELQLADWLELLVLLSPDENASYLDLERVFRREGVLGLNNDETVGPKIQSVSLELERRALAAGEAYPFRLDERSISLKGPMDQFVPYVFCLCLSFLGLDNELNKKPYPRRLFEYLCCEAARSFVDGEAVRFASPRATRDLPVEFHLAVNALCMRIKEGVGFSQKRTFSSKDDAIDVVAWREFPDEAEGKLLLIGNCASGRNWESKLDELQPHIFCEDWMIEVPVSVRFGIRAFFIPRRLNPQDWKRVSRRAGMIFDRCRIAHWVSITKEFSDRQHCLDWSRHALAQARR